MTFEGEKMEHDVNRVYTLVKTRKNATFPQPFTRVYDYLRGHRWVVSA